MNKFLDKLTGVFVGRKVTFYVACGIAVLAFIGGIIATATLNVAGISVAPLLLTLFAMLAFVVLSVFGFERIGVAVVAVASLASLVDAVCEVFGYFLNAIQSQAMGGFNIAAIPGVVGLVVTVVILLLCAIVANVLAWLKSSGEKQVSEERTETSAEVE